MVLHITSQVEHAKKRSSIDSENKFVKRSTDHQNSLMVCFYTLFIGAQYYSGGLQANEMHLLAK